ncbi:hypothetical protein BU24DRAFT_470001 [Aaosphaeria arxii CBS 175.79]|uniref:3-hydroxyisobutyrate dehydrogenase n=1 Tax=Aaosphaeria arxii CBS 175.79 TaxID=1450172 RepID=A0A6A5Y8W7_9PLEO|nr:uncharacterized protein BU24DRAFT_470001 [Aaosphaeria arxii CBS 175.79]KAF2021191.1 hypothetical protein BU24DRAFT_470001 [Aaosphaeria arxii CBS 175.79]
MVASVQSQSRLGFAGLGSMGHGMAMNLLSAGFHVTGFDPSLTARERFIREGGTVATTVATLCKDIEACMVMVANPSQADGLLFDPDGICDTIPRSSLLCIFSTLPPSYLQQLPQRLAAVGRSDIRLLDCPVSGGVIGATNGALTIIVGGSQDTLASCQHVLEAVSAPQRIFHCGDLGMGSMMKMLNQHLAGVHIVAAAEMLSFAKVMGLDARETYHQILDSQASSWIFKDRGLHMLDRDWPPASAVDIFVKDMGIVCDWADKTSVPCPIASQALLCFTECKARGHGRKDDAYVITIYENIIGTQITASNGTLAPGRNGKNSLGLPNAQLDDVIKYGTLVHLAATAECCRLAETVGLSPEVVYDLISGAAGSSAQFQDHFPSMAERAFTSDTGAVDNSPSGFDEFKSHMTRINRLMTSFNLPGRLFDAAYQILKGAHSRRRSGETSVAAIMRFWT